MVQDMEDTGITNCSILVTAIFKLLTLQAIVINSQYNSTIPGSYIRLHNT